jgi:hypothetical protein
MGEAGGGGGMAFNCHSGARVTRTTMCNCTSENLEIYNVQLHIGGLVLRTIPE